MRIEQSSQGESISFFFDTNTLFLVMEGTIRLHISNGLGSKLLEHTQWASVQRVVVDLHNCTMIDSTTLGNLVQLCTALQPNDPSRFRVHLTKGPVMDSMVMMGLPHIMNLSEESATLPVDAQWLGYNHRGSISPEQLLNAHQNLSQLNTKNAAEFSLLEGYLKKKPDQ